MSFNYTNTGIQAKDINETTAVLTPPMAQLPLCHPLVTILRSSASSSLNLLSSSASPLLVIQQEVATIEDCEREIERLHFVLYKSDQTPTTEDEKAEWLKVLEAYRALKDRRYILKWQAEKALRRKYDEEIDRNIAARQRAIAEENEKYRLQYIKRQEEDRAATVAAAEKKEKEKGEAADREKAQTLARMKAAAAAVTIRDFERAMMLGPQKREPQGELISLPSHLGALLKRTAQGEFIPPHLRKTRYRQLLSFGGRG